MCFRHKNSDFFLVPSPIWWICVLGLMGILAAIAFTEESIVNDFPGLKEIKNCALFIFRSQNNLKWIFWLANIVHVFESFVAMIYCYQLECRTWYLWLIQTALLGFPSLNLLIMETNRREISSQLD